VRTENQTVPFILTFFAHRSTRSCHQFTLRRSAPRKISFPSWRSCESARQTPSPGEPIYVYAVDDQPRLTELYAGVLTELGLLVRTFNHRGSALAALKADKPRPGLLMTDYLGYSMPVDDFLQACRMIEPRLKILMASGFPERDMRFSNSRPDYFIQKPFTPAELQATVRSVLANQCSCSVAGSQESD